VLHAISLYAAELRVLLDRHAEKNGTRLCEVSSVIPEEKELDRVLLAFKLQERVGIAHKLDLKKYATAHAGAIAAKRGWDIARHIKLCSTVRLAPPVPNASLRRGSRGQQFLGGTPVAKELLRVDEQRLAERELSAAKKRLREAEERFAQANKHTKI